MTTASLVAFAAGSAAAQAAESCSAYPTGTAEKIESSELASKLGPFPKPSKELHFTYVTKTLINEFWQDVAAGVKSEAAKYGIKVDVQAAKDELSMVEQLNLAQTVLSQKPDALLLSPQSDSNLVPVIKAAKAENIPTVIIDDARTAWGQHLYRHRPGQDRRRGCDLSARHSSQRRKGRADRRRRWLPERARSYQGLQRATRHLSQFKARR